MIVVAITGASGVIYGIRLLEALKELNIPVTFQVYKGTAKTYITFFEYNMQNEEYSEDEMEEYLEDGSMEEMADLFRSIKVVGTEYPYSVDETQPDLIQENFRLPDAPKN